jgi:DNA-binding LacI/PurR family transcriptional regulator
MDRGLELGRDVGLICQNDFVINEIVLGGLTTISSDYAKIGSDAAAMILTGELKRIHCECSLVRRNTF